MEDNEIGEGIAMKKAGALLSGGVMAMIPYLAVSPAAAQTEASNEEIVVTAQRREEAVSDVPLAIQAFGGEALERDGVRELQQVIALIPGASEGLSNSAGQRQYQLRGVPSGVGDSTVGYYLDDTAFALSGLSGTVVAPVARTFDVDRVEVLRGPQGTLYGQSAMGGTIRFITADPDLHDVRVRGQAGYSQTHGGDDNYFTDVALSAPIVEGVLGARLALSREEMGGYAESPDFPNDENLDDVLSENYRLKVLFTPTTNFLLRLGYTHNNNENDVGALLRTADPPTFVQGTDVALGNFVTEYDMFSAFASLDLGAVTLESSTGYTDYEAPFTLYTLLFGQPATISGGRTSAIFNQELRLISNGDGPFNWVVGGYYQTSDDELPAVIDSPVFPFQSLSQLETDAFALFGEVSFDLLDGGLTPLFGLRWFTDDRTYQDDDGFGGISHASETFESLSPRFNLSYRPDEDTLYFVNIAKGFRSGTFNSQGAVGLANFVGIPATTSVDPDEIWSYEVGARWSLFGGDLDLEVIPYYWTWSDMQLSVNPGLAVTLNAGEAESLGLDVSLRYRTPIDGLSLSFAGNVNDSEFTQMDPAVANADPTDSLYVGARLPASPEHTFSVGFDYTRPLTSDWRAVAIGLFSYSASQITVSGGQEGDVHRLLGLRLGAENDHWGVFLFGENLLNDDGPIYNQQQPTVQQVTRNYPRVVGLQLRFDY